MNDSWHPGFPVFLYQKDMDLPNEGTYFVVASNGIWMHKDTGICKCFVPVENIGFLDDLETKAKVDVKLPKIPEKIVWQIKHFFKIVVEYLNSESAILLYYNPYNKNYKVYVPEQIVSHGSVSYKRIATTHIEDMENYLCVGTIHSHCDFDAFHSHIDVQDEANFDGLHITFGNNDKEEFTITSSIVVNSFRSEIDPIVILEGISQKDESFYLNKIDEKDLMQDVNLWLSKVSSKNGKKILENSFYVRWSKDMKSPELKSSFGEGPFKVLAKNNDKITIQTPSGNAKLSSTFFEEIKNEQSQEN